MSEIKNLCILDPNFTIIYMFLDKFSDACGVNKLSINDLSVMIQDSTAVAPALEELHIKLLRKIRKSVPIGKWENTLAKFAHTYSNQDAWEIERFGYKNANIAVKLRILKVLLETQFDRNIKFKGYVNGLAAEELRPNPLGKDIFGNCYWCIMDRQYSIKIFRENMDDETWNIVASNREEVVKLIEQFKQSEYQKVFNQGLDCNTMGPVTNPEAEILLTHDIVDSARILNGEDDKKENIQECSYSMKYSDISNERAVKTGYLDKHVDKTEEVSDATLNDTTSIGVLMIETTNTSKTDCTSNMKEPIFSDVIEDKILFVRGHGSGADNDMGNIKKIVSAPSTKKATNNAESNNLSDDNPKITNEKNYSSHIPVEQSSMASFHNINDLPFKKKMNRELKIPSKLSTLEFESSISAETATTSMGCHLYISKNSFEVSKNLQNNSDIQHSNQYSSDKLPKKETKFSCTGLMNDVNPKENLAVEMNNISDSSNIEPKRNKLREEYSINLISNKIQSREKDKVVQKTSENIKNRVAQNEITDKKKRRKRNAVDDINTGNIITDTLSSISHPIRQSSRIAQQKIREESNRRLIEERMLRELKAESLKNKRNSTHSKSEDEDYIFSEIEDNSNMDIKIKKKKRNKPWLTSSSESSSESELEDEQDHSDDCRSFLQSDHEFSPESDVDNECLIPTKRARTVLVKGDSDSNNGDSADSIVEHACQKCGNTDHPEWILLCDFCDKGYHCSCLIPVLFVIPEGDWFCPKCEHDKLMTKLQESLILYDETCKQLDAENVKHPEITIKTATSDGKLFNENIEKSKNILKCKNLKTNLEENQLRRNDILTSSDVSSDNDTCSSEHNKLAYKLRRRNQSSLNYSFNAYDDLINSAISREKCPLEEGKKNSGKSMKNILEATTEKTISRDSPYLVKRSNKSANNLFKKRKRLNDLNSDEDDDGSDVDFTETFSEDEEEESLSLTEDSESSLELSPSRRFRCVANRKRDEEFINDDDDSDQSGYSIRTRPNKTKITYDESDEFEDEDPTESEEIDSEDLCDDTETDSSQDKKKKRNKKNKFRHIDIKDGFKKKARIKQSGEDKLFKTSYKNKMIIGTDSDQSVCDMDVLTSKRRTRGKKLHYILDEDFESSDDGITPGVLRPDTPPEERERFIQKQQEIKRMLAEKNTAAAKALATPTIIPLSEACVKSKPAVLSTIPQAVIDNAKVLDIDFLKIPRNIDSDDFEDALAVNFTDPDDVNEEELAKIMEDEDFAPHHLKLDEEDSMRNKNIIDSTTKKIRIIDNIDQADFTKDDKKDILYRIHDKRIKGNVDSLTVMPTTKLDYSNLPHDFITPKLISPDSYIPKLLSPSDKSLSLLQQMKQQAIPLRDCDDPTRPIQLSTLPHSSLYLSLSNPTNPQRQKSRLSSEKNVAPVIMESVDHKDYANIRRRRRKKITPLRGDLYKGSESGTDAPKLPQYNMSLISVENVAAKNFSNLRSVCSKIAEIPLTYRRMHQVPLYNSQASYTSQSTNQSGFSNSPSSNTAFFTTLIPNSISSQSSNSLFAPLEPVNTEDSATEQIIDPVGNQEVEIEKNSEFSGLVSYFSSQQNELNE